MSNSERVKMSDLPMLEFRVWDGKQEIGKFYIPNDASKAWIEKNIPPLIQAIRLLAGRIKKTGY